MTQQKVSAVVINYNGQRTLKQCLDSVFKNKPAELIVVDGHSQDNSLEIIAQYPAKLVMNDKNSGPVRARNVGAKAAKNEYLLFIDSDMILGQGYLDRLACFLDENQKVGVVSGKITEQGKRRRYNFGHNPHPFKDAVGNIFDRLLEKYPQSRFLQFLAEPFTLNFAPDRQRQADWVTENAFMTRRELFEKLKGLDEKFIMFYEGPDYCRRVRQAGYQVVHLPSVEAEHLGGHSHQDKRDDYFTASKKHYFGKWH